MLPIYKQKGPIVNSVVLESRTIGSTKGRQTGRCTDGVDSTIIEGHPHRPTPHTATLLQQLRLLVRLLTWRLLPCCN